MAFVTDKDLGNFVFPGRKRVGWSLRERVFERCVDLFIVRIELPSPMQLIESF